MAPICGAIVTEAFVLVSRTGNEVASALAGGVFGVAFLIFWWLIELGQRRRCKPSGRCGTLVQCPQGRLRQCLWLNPIFRTLPIDVSYGSVAAGFRGR